MVCSRCQKVVRTALENLGLHPLSIQFGQVTLSEAMDAGKKEIIKNALAKRGFGLLENRKEWVVEKIKGTIIEAIHYREAACTNFSVLIAEKVGLDYPYLSALFSSVEGLTIEKYIILQRIERAKELLVYDELSLSQIADQMGYSSVHHLSNQFKKVTGLTPSYFKKLRKSKRRPLDRIQADEAGVF
jgi:AraC-like DNA-binding protein